MKLKKFVYGILAGMIAFGAATDTTSAMSRQEISQIKVSKSGNFKYWNKDSEARQKLVAYVKDVTNKSGKNFIPIEDRIAVFDMDGTFLCETAPSYFNRMLYIHRVLHDKNFTPSPEDKKFATEFEKALKEKKSTVKLGSSTRYQISTFFGMTLEDYANCVEDFMRTPVEGLKNLKWGEAFYLPMVEVIKYLQANDFKVFVVSGTERQTIRILLGDMLKIPPENVIGTDVQFLATNQGDTDGEKYLFDKSDKLIRGGILVKNSQMNKVSAIERNIGRQPVLAFGNSSGDLSMLNYTISGNKHKSAAFFILCDDLEREFGNENVATKDKKLADDNGWNTVSMKYDFKTIYGDDVKVER